MTNMYATTKILMPQMGRMTSEMTTFRHFARGASRKTGFFLYP